MSLLTEADIIKIHPWMQLPKGDGPDTDMDTHVATAEAQQTKALKAVAEWLGEYCDNPKHESQAKRIACIRCLWELQDAGTFGKMPGEE